LMAFLNTHNYSKKIQIEVFRNFARQQKCMVNPDLDQISYD
jgi:hypothetical protein